MMFSGFNADYEASSSRCSSASPAGDSLSYYHSPADSFSSMGSPVNAQVRLAPRRRRARGWRGHLGEITGARRSGRRVRDSFRQGQGGRLAPAKSSPLSGAPNFGAARELVIRIASLPRQALSEL